MTILSAICEARDVLVKLAVTDEDWALVARTDDAITRLERLIDMLSWPQVDTLAERDYPPFTFPPITPPVDPVAIPLSSDEE